MYIACNWIVVYLPTIPENSCSSILDRLSRHRAEGEGCTRRKARCWARVELTHSSYYTACGPQRPERADSGKHKCSGETWEINTCGKAKEKKQKWAMETGRCGAVSCSQWISWPIPQRSQTGGALQICPGMGQASCFHLCISYTRHCIVKRERRSRYPHNSRRELAGGGLLAALPLPGKDPSA